MEQLQQPKSRITKIILASIIVLILVIFSIQNSGSTSVSILFWGGSAPLVLLFFICFLLGLSFALLALYPLRKYSKKQSKLITELQKRIELLENHKPNLDKKEDFTS